MCGGNRKRAARRGAPAVDISEQGSRARYCHKTKSVNYRLVSERNCDVLVSTALVECDAVVTSSDRQRDIRTFRLFVFR